MEPLSATDAARRFSQVLDAVERKGQSFVVVRHGKPVATIAPAAVANGRAIKEVLSGRGRDPAWSRELAELRAGLVIEERTWPA